MLVAGQVLCGLAWGKNTLRTPSEHPQNILRTPSNTHLRIPHTNDNPGVFATVGPSYASEVCPTNLRGYMTTYVNLCWYASHHNQASS